QGRCCLRLGFESLGGTFHRRDCRIRWGSGGVVLCPPLLCLLPRGRVRDGRRLREFFLAALANLPAGRPRLRPRRAVAQAPLPQPDFRCERVIARKQLLSLVALAAVQSAKDVFGGKPVDIGWHTHALRHSSTSTRLCRNAPLSTSSGMSSFTESCSRLNAP